MTIPKFISPGQALWSQRETIAALRGRFIALSAAVGGPTDLNLYQWAEFAAFALEFRPDLIIELGRGLGNSTCCFIEVAHQFGGAKACRVLSLCQSDDWFSHTVPRLKRVVPSEWFAPAQTEICNLLEYDVTPALERAGRCLILWDAHGFDIAEWVLAKLLPQLIDKPHLVLMHDMSDTQFETPGPEYGGNSIWKGTNATTPAFWLGRVFSRVAQAISIVDFTSRNQLPLHSAAESLHAEIANSPVRMTELKKLLGPELFSLQAHWFWFTLNEASTALSFPAYTPASSASKVTQSELQIRPDRTLQEKQRLEAIWREVQHSAGWRMLNAWRTARNGILPVGTRRRRLYDSVLGPLRDY